MRAFREILAAGCAALSLAGCVSAPPPQPDIVDIRTVAGNFRDVTACAYQVLRERFDRLGRVGLPGSGHIVRGDRQGYVWILEFRPAGAGVTELWMRAGSPRTGEPMRSEDVIPLVVAACG